jgi:signal transduction histidine kinase
MLRGGRIMPTNEPDREQPVVPAVLGEWDRRAKPAAPPSMPRGTVELEKLSIADEPIQAPRTPSGLASVRRSSDGARGALRDEDIAEIVHDLKSPLSTIALESELLEVGLGDVAPDSVRGAVNRITLNVRFLDRMIHDLLDFCSIDAGQFMLQRGQVELQSLIEQVIDRMVASRDRARIRFQSVERIVVDIDDLRIERVIANLIQNAFKYTPACSSVVVTLDRRPQWACVSVIDAGPGVAMSDRMEIFDKYRRVHGERVRDGSGLGLYVSKRIIEAHGGHIGVKSAGNGACFFFELPLT